MESGWNPWHGCKKVSAGCLNCYVYRIDAAHGSRLPASECRKTESFTLPIRKKRDGSYKIPSGSVVFTCFSSDFFISDADEWRPEAWKMIKERSDCTFFFYTKRIERFSECIPDDWGDGYENVVIGCTVENQKMADFRLPIFLSVPIRHREIGIEPMLEKIDISSYIGNGVETVSAGGESGPDARICDFDWVLDIRRQCTEKKVRFYYHQTGARLRKNGKIYTIPRELQGKQARKANIDLEV